MNQKTSFGSWYRCVGKNKETLENLEEGVEYRNNTGWFRNGREIPDIIDSLVVMYKDADHVNTYIYGCSNGSGSSSGWIYLTTKYGEETASKFGPFKAKDIDKHAVRIAKKGEMPISYDEFLKIQQYSGYRFNDFLHGESLGITNEYIDPSIPRPDLERIFDVEEAKGIFDIYEGACIKPKKTLTDNIEYSVANILEDYVNIVPENSVVGAKNFWPYLKREEITELLSNLGQRLKKGCSLFFGEYDFFGKDREPEFTEFLQNSIIENGFQKAKGKSPFLFEKI